MPGKSRAALCLNILLCLLCLCARPAVCSAATPKIAVYGFSEEHNKSFTGTMTGNPARESVTVSFVIPGVDISCSGSSYSRTAQQNEKDPSFIESGGLLTCSKISANLRFIYSGTGAGAASANLYEGQRKYFAYGMPREEAMSMLAALAGRAKPGSHAAGPPKPQPRAEAPAGKPPAQAAAPRQAPQATVPKQTPKQAAPSPDGMYDAYAYSDKLGIFLSGTAAYSVSHGKAFLSLAGPDTNCSGSVIKFTKKKKEDGGDVLVGEGTLQCGAMEVPIHWLPAGPASGTVVGPHPDNEGFFYIFYGFKKEEAGEMLVELARKLNPASPLLAAEKNGKANGPAGKKPEKKKKGMSMGSGFFVSNNGILVTNWHVVDEAQTLKIYMPRLRKTVPAELIDSDPVNDIAILKADFESKGLPLYSGGVSKGEEIVALGYPAAMLQGVEQKATFGRINALSGLGGDRRFYQIDAPIHPGNSGGPILNVRGEVVGVVTSTVNQDAAYETMGTFAQNLNFAVKIDYVNVLLRSLGDEYVPVPSGADALDMPALVKLAEPSVAMVLAE